MATSLAMALAELLQNAIRHGQGAEGTPCLIELHQENDGEAVRFRIVDHGTGLPDGFDLARDAGLGITIVQTLIRDDLGGALQLSPAGRGSGAVATLTAPLPRRPASTM
jgi:two-component sensor histidine kinase